MALLVLAAAGVAGACGGDGGRGAGDGASTTAAPATTVAPTTSTTAAPPSEPRATGREAIDALLERWRAGDRAGALAVAAPDAVEALFAVPPEPGQARGCNDAGPNVTVQCVFRLGAGELQVRAAPTPDGAGFLVDLVILGS